MVFSLGSGGLGFCLGVCLGFCFRDVKITELVLLHREMICIICIFESDIKHRFSGAVRHLNGSTLLP